MKRKEAEALIITRLEELKKGIVKRKGFFYGQSDETDGHPEFVRLHKSYSKDEKVIEFQKHADDIYLMSVLLDKPAEELEIFKSYMNFVETSDLAKAMDTSNTANWIPTGFSRQLVDKVQEALMVARLFFHQTMPTSPFEVPVKSAFSTTRKGTEGAAPTASSVGDTKVTLTAVKLIDYVPLSYELNEDAAFALLPKIREDIANSIARAVDDCDVNGDTSVTHQDSDVTAADDRRKCWKGLRKHALEQSYKVDLGTFTAETVISMLSTMGSPYGANKKMLAWVGSVTTETKMYNLKDSSGNRIYQELGSKNPIINGQTGALAGIPYMNSEFMREDLNASGVYDGTTTTKTGLLLVRKDGFLHGDRRKMMVEMDKDIKSQVIDLVASTRMDFQPQYPIAANKVVIFGYNV